MMKHPILLALGAGLLVLLLAFAAPLYQMRFGTPPAAPPQGLPWQAAAQADGSLQVFGLALGRDTLAQARAQIGDGLQVALVARLGEVGALEALAEPYAAGFVSGRLVLAFEVPAATLAQWRDRSAHSEAMEGGVRRFKLQPADLAAAGSARLVGISFVPALRLSADDVRQRFGAPAQVLPLPDYAQLLLYPAIGLAASVGEGRRGVLQYVAPGDFEARLRAPLAASAPGG